MNVAGIVWGVYSLRGRLTADALGSTATNFLCCAPLVATVSLFALRDVQASPAGVGLAIASSAVASGLGYVVWFAALRGLTASRAATVQLSVPVIAAFGGIVLLAEDVSLRLLIASIATLGGIWIVLAQPDRNADVR